jgi:hypothetical protein
MRPSVRTLLLLLGALVTLYLAFLFGLSRYDAATKKEWLYRVGQELPPRASMREMDAFMQQHTTGYDLDTSTMELGGFLPQSRLDRILMNRKVGIYLKVGIVTTTFKQARIEVYYTFL